MYRAVPRQMLPRNIRAELCEFSRVVAIGLARPPDRDSCVYPSAKGKRFTRERNALWLLTFKCHDRYISLPFSSCVEDRREGKERSWTAMNA